MTTPSSQKCGFVAIIGAPNAGKSTLVNALVGTKVSIVTQKVQTTRFPVRGIAIEGDSQMILVDTPGIFKPKKRLERAMVRSAHAQAKDADMIVVLVDAAAQLNVLHAHADNRASGADMKSAQDVETVIEDLKGAGSKAILVLNKIDLIRRDQLLSLSDELFKSGVFTDVLMISAHNGNGVGDLRTFLAKSMPSGVWLYPEDQAADAPMRLLAAEMTREKLFLRVHEELPYAAAVVTTSFLEKDDGSIRIEQDIYVERDGQRAIVLGKNGQTLKWIGQKSREELSLLLGTKVHLFLHVKVNERWSDDRFLYQTFGLDYDA
jgi:GTP-binding protein Era